jgi:RNA polymerase sigma-70 factor (ECF subfamily)
MKSHSTYNDAELLVFLRNGDGSAFEAIYPKYWLKLCDTAFKRLSEKEPAKDIVQNIFARLWLNRSTLAVDNLPAYLQTSVKHGVLNYLRKQKSSRYFEEPFEEILAEKEEADTKLLAKDLMELIHAYSNTLPSKRREIFLLRIKEKLSTREIAETLNISQKTVQNQLKTALDGLPSHLAPIVLLLIGYPF